MVTQRLFLASSLFENPFSYSQAMAVTRVTIAPKEGGPNDSQSIHSQSGVLEARKFSGSGSDTDIMTSSARAYVSALNKLLTWNARRVMQASNEGKVDSNSVEVEAEQVQVAESP